MSANVRPSISRIKPVVVTGGAGFIGSNLADRLASEGEHVLVFDALLRNGVERNLDWLRSRHRSRISVVTADVRNAPAITAAMKDATAVFHLAAQVAVTTSLADPLEDFSINVAGTLNVLDALRRRNRPVPLVFASTNKVYGDLSDLVLARRNCAYAVYDEPAASFGIAESRALDFHTPYGCSKGAADQYVLDYAHSFAMPTAVMRMSCIYGPRQFGTEDQGWVAHFLMRALTGEPISVFGDGCQVRDILYVADAVEAYVAAWRHIGKIKGRAYNLGGGPRNAVSLIQLLAHVERLLGRPIAKTFHDWRPGDQRYYVSDARRVVRDLGLPAPLPWRDGVARLLAWLQDETLPRLVEPERERLAASLHA